MQDDGYTSLTNVLMFSTTLFVFERIRIIGFSKILVLEKIRIFIQQT